MNLKTHNFSFEGSFSKNKYCDVKLSTLDAGARCTIAAHKVVLAAASAKLEKLLDRAGEGVGPVIVIDIRFTVLEKIVELIYSGRVEIEDEDVEDFQDGLDMLGMGVNKLENHNETLVSIAIPDSEVRNVPPVGEMENISVSEVITFEDDEVEVPNNLTVSTSQRNVKNSSEAVPNNNIEEVPGKVSKFASSDAQPRLRLLSISYSDCNSDAPQTSTPSVNIPQIFSFSSPAVSKISVAVRKLQRYRSQAESVASPKVKVLNPCYAVSEVSDAESLTEPEKDEQPPPDHKMNNNTPGKSIMRKDSILRNTVVKCPICGDQMSYRAVSKHLERKHPKVVKSSGQVCCKVCRQTVRSCIYELHLQVYHLKDAEKASLCGGNLGKSVEQDTVTGMSPNLKRRLEEVGNENKLKSQKMEIRGQSLFEKPGKYEAFCEDVSEEGVGWGQRKVRCLLCGDGKLHYKKNIAAHFKALHEPPVKCPSCGVEFTVEQMKIHTLRCPSKNAQVSQEINQSVKFKFVMDNITVRFEQKARTPILKAMKKFSQRSGVLMNCLEFKVDNIAIDGSELASEFDEKIIEVFKV